MLLFIVIFVLITAKIIPVLRRGEEIPASLRFINYIDARDDVDDTYVVNKLARALTEGKSYLISDRELFRDRFRSPACSD